MTGETGAGKTLVVEAIELLVGGRADSRLVRPGAEEARVDGRFRTPDGDEVVISRVVPRDGRSRAYLDGRPASLSELAELGAALVDLQGQHAQQSLLSPAAQRDALDRYAGIDPAPRRAARAELRRLEAELAGCGGDEPSRARQRDFLRFQLDELEAAELEDGDEDERLEAEEDAARRRAGAPGGRRPPPTPPSATTAAPPTPSPPPSGCWATGRRSRTWSSGPAASPPS